MAYDAPCQSDACETGRWVCVDVTIPRGTAAIDYDSGLNAIISVQSCIPWRVFSNAAAILYICSAGPNVGPESWLSVAECVGITQ